MRRISRKIGPCGKPFEYLSDRCDFCKNKRECLKVFMTLEEWLNEEIERRFPTDILVTLDRWRPCDNEQQPERMKTEVKGITFRDLRDCFIRALYDASPIPAKDYPKSVYDLPLDEIDIMAVEQNMACWVEKYMGIYPNCPNLSESDIDKLLAENTIEYDDD